MFLGDPGILFQEGSIVGQDGTFHFYVYVFMYNYVCVFIHRLACTIDFSGLTINSTILFDFFQTSSLLFYLPFFLSRVSPPHFPHQSSVYLFMSMRRLAMIFSICCCVSLPSFSHEIRMDLLKEHCRASDMARWVKASAANCDDGVPVPRTQEGEENRLLQAVLCHTWSP